jgi:GNAT superfamily N-acetyltransferase
VVTISTDDALLDVDRIHRWLSEDAYWALGRSRETVEHSLRHSVNVGAYDQGPDGSVQVGFLRIVTDRATFAWVCDVYVDPAARGRRVGKLLMAEADRLLGEYGVRRAMLATADAHGLYAQYGFTPMADPDRWMERGYEQ